MFGGRFFEKGKTGCSFGKQRIFSKQEKAKSSIMAGVVFVNDKKEDKPGVKVDVDSIITIKENVHPYVSRGGLKLEKAIRFLILI